jgi:hypothetical protein
MFDFVKYKRFFSFGCSFTNTTWPTWANLIAKECVNAEFYNFGISGSGNVCIASRISEINQRYNFCDTDLVMVLWSTFSRDDRFVDGKWETHGSVYTGNPFFTKEYVKKYCDYSGFVIRDLALIDLVNGYIKQTNCTYYDMLSVKPGIGDHFVEYNDDVFLTTQILPVYNNFLERYKTSYYEVYPWNEHVITENGRLDTHPNPLHAYKFLKKLGISLSLKTLDYAKETTEYLKDANRSISMDEYFKDINVLPEDTKFFKNKFGLPRTL